MRAGHPWLFASSIREVNREGRAGDPAVIFDRKNRFLAAGLWDPEGPIRVRILVSGKPAPIGADLFRRLVAEAVSLRKPLLDDPTRTGVRILYGESDGFSGVVADLYGEHLVLKIYSPAWIPRLRELVEALEGELAPRSILLLAARRVAQEPAVIMGEFPADETLPFVEAGLRYEAHPVQGHKTGFYLDQRDNRARLGRLTGPRVLNVFSYTGGFSLAAAAGGATAVTSLDVSEAALAQAERHFELNAHLPAVAAARHRTLKGDAFEAMGELARSGTRFDTVVVDPPSFAKEARQAAGALDQYGRLTRLALRVLAPGGLLLQASCSSRVPAEDLFLRIHQVARDAGRPLDEVERTGHPLDHPVRIPENAYLTALLARAP
ncbi:23S rRNA (cytosine(2499)-C(5))-methyltransferase [soil metagenome]